MLYEVITGKFLVNKGNEHIVEIIRPENFDARDMDDTLHGGKRIQLETIGHGVTAIVL